MTYLSLREMRRLAKMIIACSVLQSYSESKQHSTGKQQQHKIKAHIEQGNKGSKGGLDVNPCTWSQSVCNQGSKNVGWGRTVTLLIVLLIVLASNGYSLRKNETEHSHAVHKISKEIRDSRVKPPSQGLE